MCPSQPGAVLMEKEPVVYVNGELLRQSQAKISVLDLGLIFGDGVFDTMVTANGYVFKLDQHVDRFFASARAVRIDVKKSKEEIKKLIMETVRRNGLRDAYVKIILTRGVAAAPLMGKADTAGPTLIIFAVPPAPVVAEERIRSGAKLLSTTIRRAHPDSLDPRIKSLNYQPNMLMRREALEGGADEAVCYGFDGYVAEGGGDNIWMVRDKVLLTPTHGVLEGITRETVFEIAAELGYKALTANISRYDLYQADEVFLCSTAGGIIPVTEVDHRAVGNGKPGSITQKVREAYLKMLQDGRHGTPVPT